jgi:hypothetical protein
MTIANTEIEEMIRELAYQRVKHSYLFNVLSNAQVDQKADELAAGIAPVVEQWIMAEVDAEAQRQNEMDEFVGTRTTCLGVKKTTLSARKREIDTNQQSPTGRERRER